jgi:hypothetical protein
MNKEEVARFIRMVGIVYIPIAFLVLIIFVLVNHYLGVIEEERDATGRGDPPSLIVPVPPDLPVE